jgi:hypothetical protein
LKKKILQYYNITNHKIIKLLGMDNKHKYPHLELILKIVNDEYTPTLADLISITGNKYLDITIPNGIKLVKYYYGLSQIVIDKEKLEKVQPSTPFLFTKPNTQQVAMRNSNSNSKFFHPTPWRSPIMVAGAYKGAYSSDDENFCSICSQYGSYGLSSIYLSHCSQQPTHSTSL